MKSIVAWGVSVLLQNHARRFILPMIAVAFATGASNAYGVSCGDTVTENLTLASDLNCSGTDGLRVGADGIVIILGSHTVTGDSTPGFVGIRVRGFTNVVISGGTIREFDHGIVVETNGVTTSSATILNVKAVNNLGFGFLTTSPPGAPPSSTTLIRNTALDNGEAGILFDKGTFAAFDNVSAKNAVGIRVGGANGLLIGGALFSNDQSGLEVEDVIDNNILLDAIINVDSVIASANGGSGFFITDGADATFSDNKSIKNAGFGYECVAGTTIIDAGNNTAIANGDGQQTIECDLDL